MKGLKVQNEVTGATGHIVGVWRNEFSGRLVVNVRLTGQRSGFVMWDAAQTVNLEKTAA